MAQLPLWWAPQSVKWCDAATILTTFLCSVFDPVKNNILDKTTDPEAIGNMATLPPSVIEFQEAHIRDNLSTTVIAVCNINIGLALLFLFIRLLARRHAKAHLGLDDYLAIAAMVPLIGLDVTASLTAHYGIGRHLIWVAQKPENFIYIGKTELAFSVFYDWSMALGKLSILALLARVFTLHKMWFKVSVYFWATWVVLWWTTGEVLIFLECRPLSTSWGDPTQCRPTFRASVATGIFNSISDVGMLILPQPMIWQLQLPFPRKFGLSILFLVGSFASAVGIARIPLLRGANAGSNNDSTYTSAIPVMFTVLEPANVLLCACLPMSQGLVKRVSNSKMMSYFSLSLMRSSRRGKGGSGDIHREPVALDIESKPGQWTKLEERLLPSEAKSEARRGSALADGHGIEEYEMTSTTIGVGRRVHPTEARDLV